MKWIQITDVIKWIAVCVAISISVYVTRMGDTSGFFSSLHS